MTPVSESEQLRSTVCDGGKFPAGCWQRVGRLADVVDELSVDVFGGPEGVSTYVPRIGAI
jgi:hypothetical protein